MYDYNWDPESGGLILKNTPPKINREPRPVYSRELDVLGFDKVWSYPKTDDAPIMWAEGPNYIYRGRRVAKRMTGVNLYTPPTFKFFDMPPEFELFEGVDPSGRSLRPVDVKGMVEKNRALMDALTDEAVNKIREVYSEYKDKIGGAMVGFSGGKDSVVALDLTLKALPHDAFLVMFDDTKMENADTYDLVEEIEDKCKNDGVSFIASSSPLSAEDSWRSFGPPSRNHRWCCSVHKSMPGALLLRRIFGNNRVLCVFGTRGGESYRRSKYERIEQSRKTPLNIQFCPILAWSSAEVFLYIWANGLPLNLGYKKGCRRVGCTVCPFQSSYIDWLVTQTCPEESKKYYDYVLEYLPKDKLKKESWKGRMAGVAHDLKFTCEEKEDRFRFDLKEYNEDWREWYKTMGEMGKEDEWHYVLEFKGVWRSLTIAKGPEGVTFEIEKRERNKNSIEFFGLFKRVMTKALYCVKCNYCVVKCPFGNIKMTKDSLKISDDCKRCGQCMNKIIFQGCIRFDSLYNISPEIKKERKRRNEE